MEFAGLKCTARPTFEPVTVADAKSQLRIGSDVTDEDAKIGGFIATARELAEQFMGRQIMPATWQLTLDEFPSTIEVPMPPLVSATVNYYDTTGATQNLASGNIVVDTASEPGRIEPAYGYSWPSIRPRAGAVTVTFRAGYATLAEVPENIKHFIRALACHLYTHAGDDGTEFPATMWGLLRPYKRVRT